MTGLWPGARRQDWLLASARVLILAAKAILCLIMLGVGIGAIVLLAGQEDIAAALLAGGTGVALGMANLGIAVFLLGLLVLIAVIFHFVQLLGRIVGTVAAGDPFIVANADRLSRMAWLALAAQLLGFALDLLGAWLGTLFPDGFGGESWHFSVDRELYLSPEGILLALVLFILARVFRHGTAMRDDLEGTV